MHKKRRSLFPAANRSNQRVIDVPLPFRGPYHFASLADKKDKWLAMLRTAERLIHEDIDLQKKSAKGLTIKGRSIPPEILGRMYTQYCTLINDLYDAYANNLQLQRCPYIQEIVSIFVKRMFELRNELVHFIVNDYVYVDAALQQLFKTPYDIEIVVPYHIALDSRKDSIEELLQTMWRKALKRKIRAERRAKTGAVKPRPALRSLSKLEVEPLETKSLIMSMGSKHNSQKQVAEEEEVEEEESEEEIIPYGSEHIILTDDFIYARLIQRHERFRQFYKKDFLAKCLHRRKYDAKVVVFYPPEIQESAALLIQMIYREYMEIKRRRVLEHKRNVILGLVPDFETKKIYCREERNKIHEKHRQTRRRLNVKYLEEIEKQKIRILLIAKDEQIVNITQEIREWFKEWYFGYGFFPQYPYPVEGGTLVVVKGEYPTIEEQYEADELYKKNNKNINPEQKRNAAKQAKIDAIAKKEAAKEREKKQAAALFKARCNPDTDPGYTVKISAQDDELVMALRSYRQSWSLYDMLPVECASEVVYGYMKSIIAIDLMKELHAECRKYVDELMRLDLKLLVKTHQNLYREVGRPWPKVVPRPRPKKPKPLRIPPAVTNEVLKSLEKLFDLEIISKPTAKFDDIEGDLSYSNYDYNIQDPMAMFPPPAYGDVKRRLILSCAFGSGLEPGAERQKAVMLVGPPMNGKSFLVDAVAGELNAVKIDLSPPVFSAKTRQVKKMMNLVLIAAQVFQPTVIFIKNVEKLFYAKIPPEEKADRPTALKVPLKNFLKRLPIAEKVILIATCSNPWAAKVKPMMKMFNQKILVPLPDYGTIQSMLYYRLQKIRSMPRDFCVASLAKTLEGFSLGVINQIFNVILNPERIVKLSVYTLREIEFVEYLIQHDMEPMTRKEFEKWQELVILYSPLKKEREEYAIINKKRAEAYEKLAKKKAAEKKS